MVAFVPPSGNDSPFLATWPMDYNLQVVITHPSQVCSQHSFELPQKMNGMHKTQFDHQRFNLQPLIV